MSEILDLELRKQIYRLLIKQPGLNLSTIASHLDISIALALYHLRYLERNNLLISHKEEGSLRYYIRGETVHKERKYHLLLRKKIPLKLILYLLKHPAARHRDMKKNLQLSGSLLTYHLNKLIKKEIIRCDHSQHNPGEYHVINKKEIIHFLIKYEPYRFIEGLSDTWEDFHIG